MHLQQHATFQPVTNQRPIHIIHRALDNIGRGPLNRRVESRAFGKRTPIEIATVNIRQDAKTSVHRFRAPRFFRRCNRIRHILANFGIALEIFFNIRARLFAADAEIARQTVGYAIQFVNSRPT